MSKKKIETGQSHNLVVQTQVKRKITYSIACYIATRTYHNPILSSQALADEILRIFSTELNRRTIDRMRHQHTFSYTRRVQALYLTDENKKKRLEFAKRHIELGTDFRNVLFTDEAYIALETNTSFVWMIPGDRRKIVSHEAQAHPKKVMIWGGVSYNHKPELIVVRETMTSALYVTQVFASTTLIDDMNRVYDGDWSLLQDRATPHTAKLTVDFFEGKVTVLDFPPYSPDLNIIENIWGWMKVKIAERNIQDIDVLLDIIQQLWNEALRQGHIRALIDTMPRRLRDVVKNEGGQVNF